MLEFEKVLEELSKPFDPKVVQFRAGATNREKTKAQALAFVDLREYQQRLDDVVAGAWEVRVEPLGQGALKVSLTIMGHTREDVGEADPEDANTYTSAFAQGFKRACAAFGLGRYLYRLPKVWVAYDAQRKKLLETPGLPKWAIPEGSNYVPPMSSDLNERVAADRGLEPPQPQAQPAARRTNGSGNPAEVVIKFGKYRGKTLGEILAEDEGYVRWLAEKSSNNFIASRARALLEAQPAEAVEAKPHDLPVAAAEPEAVSGSGNGNGHNNNVPEDPFGDFDEIPF